MPLYEYQCEQCNHRFEVIRKFSDPPVETCPKCGGPVRKLMSSPAIQFKGSGWYITDYAKKDSAPAKSETRSETKADGKAKTEGKSESSDSGKSSDAKADTKTETKSDPAKTTKPA
jgi:putative FmdB family regulatory protein